MAHKFDPVKISGHYYRGDHCHFMPSESDMKTADALEKHILSGWLPEKPFITKQHRIVAFGSCFAAHILHYLDDLGYDIGKEVEGGKSTHHGCTFGAGTYVANYGDGMVNTFTIRQQFEWALENRKFRESTWYYTSTEAAELDESVRLNTQYLFDRSDIFIITLGLSEVWYDTETGDVFWRAIPSDMFDENKHAFRVSSCEENKENIRKILSLIKIYRPGASVILTLSPVGLQATFRKENCITANSVSKAILRAAIDEVYRETGGFYYWPSYELINHGFSDPFKEDRNHPKECHIGTILNLFRKYYLV